MAEPTTYAVPSKEIVESWAGRVKSKEEAQARVRRITRDLHRLSKMIRRGSQEVLALENKWNLPPFSYMNTPISDDDDVQRAREDRRVQKWNFVQLYARRRKEKKRKREAVEKE